jgi:hypothetical protein
MVHFKNPNESTLQIVFNGMMMYTLTSRKDELLSEYIALRSATGSVDGQKRLRWPFVEHIRRQGVTIVMGAQTK